MPFSKTTEAHDEKYWDNFFETFLKPALEQHAFAAYKSVDAPNNITKHIIRELAMADLVLAVLTDNKPNVFYELGVRHSLRQGTIMILEGDKRPFDISNYGILRYKDDNLEKFKTELGRYIKIANERNEDSPVADFLNQRITVSVNLAIGRLRQCVEILTRQDSLDIELALAEIRDMQKTWETDREQVTVAINDIIKLHARRDVEEQPASNCWKDETFESKSLYHVMKDRRWGFRIAQVQEHRNRLTAIAFEKLDKPDCMVVAEAHYYQENRPY